MGGHIQDQAQSAHVGSAGVGNASAVPWTCIHAGAAAWHTGLEGRTSASVLLVFHGLDGELSLLSCAPCCRYNDKLDDYDLLN